MPQDVFTRQRSDMAHTLDSVRLYELGPIVEKVGRDAIGLVNTEVEIKNIYRTLRSLVAAADVLVTPSMDGKEVVLQSTTRTIVSGTHELSDGSVHTDIYSTVNNKEQAGSFLAWDATTSHERWELCGFKNRLSDLEDDTFRNYRQGVYLDYEPNLTPFGGFPQSIGGAHRFAVLSADQGSFITLRRSSVTNSVKVAFEKQNFTLADISDVSYIAHGGVIEEGDIIQGDATGNFRTTSHFLMLTSESGSTESFMRCRRQRPSASAVQSGDILFRMDMEGWDGSFWGDGARIIATATENFSVGNHGTKLEFYTVDNGSNTLDLRMAIDQDGSVDIGGDLTVNAINVTDTSEITNLNADKLDAGGTGRDWDDVEYTRQIFLPCVGLTTATLSYHNGTTGADMSPVATGTPPNDSAHYACHIPDSWKSASTVTLKWRFYNANGQSGQNDVLWRVLYNSQGSSGVIGSVDTGGPTTNLANNQAAFTVIEESLSLSNIAAGDLLNVTLSVDDDAATTATGSFVVLDCPWVEVTLQGVPDTGAAA